MRISRNEHIMAAKLHELAEMHLFALEQLAGLGQQVEKGGLEGGPELAASSARLLDVNERWVKKALKDIPDTRGQVPPSLPFR